MKCQKCGLDRRRRGYATCPPCADAGSSFSQEQSAPSKFEIFDEPDWESIVADREEADFDEDAAQDRVDNAIYGP